MTPEIGLVSALDHASTGIMLSKNGGALTIRHATVTATTYDAYGNYRVTLDTTDTNTLGTLRMQFIETATCLPVWMDFQVVTANVWDSLHSTDVLDVSVTQWLGTAASTPTVAGVPNINVKTWNDLTTVALPLVPTTAGRTLDVSAGGEAGLDWANVGSPTTTVGLTNTTVGVVTLVNTLTTYTGNTLQTGNVATLITTVGTAGAGLTDLGGMSTTMKAQVESEVDDALGSGTGAALTAIPWNAAWDAEVQSEVQDAIEVNHLDHLLAADYDPAAKPGVSTALLNELVGSDAGVSQFTANALELAPTGGSAPTVQQIVDGILDEDITTHVDADSVAIAIYDTSVGVTDLLSGVALNTGVINSSSFASGAITAAALAADAATEIATAVRTGTAMTEAYAADGSAPTIEQALCMILQLLSERSISGTTMTIKKLNGSTTAMTYTLDDATNPTSQTRSG